MKKLSDNEVSVVSGGVENDYNCMCIKDYRPKWDFTSIEKCVSNCCTTNEGAWTYIFQNGNTTGGLCSDFSPQTINWILDRHCIGICFPIDPQPFPMRH